MPESSRLPRVILILLHTTLADRFVRTQWLQVSDNLAISPMRFLAGPLLRTNPFP